MFNKFDIVPGQTWGTLPKELQDSWVVLSCDKELCQILLKKYEVKPGLDWGLLPSELQNSWEKMKCDQKISS
jgi:hypothetical protein